MKLSPATPALIIAASPRAGGNSDTAARLFLDGVEAAGGSAVLVHLREHEIMPCLGCGVCRKGPHACALIHRDHAENLLALIARAPFVAVASPIFFYHLPAQLKALIDRGQRWYERRESGDPEVLALPRRPVYTMLVGGQKKGEKLFECSLLTLRYFFVNFGLRLAEPLTFRGVDAPGDLEKSHEAPEALRAYGTAAWLAHGHAVAQDVHPIE